jgi:type III restriction enzyme
MGDPFFDQPILNTPYEYPTQHWELDTDGQPTQKTVPSRRPAEFITPIPKPKKRGKKRQRDLGLDNDEGIETSISTAEQLYKQTAELVNDIRKHVNEWCAGFGKTTPETERLLNRWRNHKFSVGLCGRSCVIPPLRWQGAKCIRLLLQPLQESLRVKLV